MINMVSSNRFIPETRRVPKLTTTFVLLILCGIIRCMHVYLFTINTF